MEEEKAGQGKRAGQHFVTYTCKKSQLESTLIATQHHRYSHHFSAHVYCGQTAGWIKMLLGTEVGLGPGHNVLDGDPAPPPKKGTQQPPIFGLCVLWPNCWTDQDATWSGGRPRPRPHCVRCVSTVLNTDWQLESACQTLDLKRAIAKLSCIRSFQLSYRHPKSQSMSLMV